VSLAATLELPVGTGPFPAAILVHGHDETKESPELRALASELRETGLATLRFDLSGCGASAASAEPEPARFMRDLAGIFAWSLTSPDLDRRRIAIFGRGLGAWVAVRAAVDGQVGPAALALWSPPLQRRDLSTLDVPCLLVVGDQDPNLAGVAAAAAALRLARLEIVGGAGQRLSERGAIESATRFVTRWLGQQLLARQAASL
jgi:alpha-beta hydrolase superfamily lysophospholipase